MIDAGPPPERYMHAPTANVSIVVAADPARRCRELGTQPPAGHRIRACAIPRDFGCVIVIPQSGGRERRL